jgi:hypothetical protein
MAPEVGLEPTTLRLTAECSAIELLRIAWRTQATGRLLLNLYNKCAEGGSKQRYPDHHLRPVSITANALAALANFIARKSQPLPSQTKVGSS